MDLNDAVTIIQETEYFDCTCTCWDEFTDFIDAFYNDPHIFLEDFIFITSEKSLETIKKFSLQEYSNVRVDILDKEVFPITDWEIIREGKELLEENKDLKALIE